MKSFESDADLERYLRAAFPGTRDAGRPDADPADLVDALSRLDELGLAVVATPDGRAVVRGPSDLPADVAVVLREHSDLLAAVAIGRSGRVTSGGPSNPTLAHDLGRCTHCGGVRMVGVTTGRLAGRDKWPACGLSPGGCTGRYVPTDVRRWKSAAA
jgi:hypothetical protein